MSETPFILNPQQSSTTPWSPCSISLQPRCRVVLSHLCPTGLLLLLRRLQLLRGHRRHLLLPLRPHHLSPRRLVLLEDPPSRFLLQSLSVRGPPAYITSDGNVKIPTSITTIIDKSTNQKLSCPKTTQWRRRWIQAALLDFF